MHLEWHGPDSIERGAERSGPRHRDAPAPMTRTGYYRGGRHLGGNDWMFCGCDRRHGLTVYIVANPRLMQTVQSFTTCSYLVPAVKGLVECQNAISDYCRTFAIRRMDRHAPFPLDVSDMAAILPEYHSVHSILSDSKLSLQRPGLLPQPLRSRVTGYFALPKIHMVLTPPTVMSAVYSYMMTCTS
jgi:hypothetical protein